MELDIYLWVKDVTAFIRELIRFFRMVYPDNKIEYREKYDPLDNVLDRYIYGTEIWLKIEDYDDEYFEFIAEEYSADVNLGLLFDDIDFGERPMIIAEIVNWIMRTSDTDLVIIPESEIINFKRVQGKIYYGRENDFWSVDYIPVKYLDFDREKAFEFTHDDEWVFRSEKTIREMEQWRKEKEKL